MAVNPFSECEERLQEGISTGLKKSLQGTPDSFWPIQIFQAVVRRTIKASIYFIYSLGDTPTFL